MEIDQDEQAPQPKKDRIQPQETYQALVENYIGVEFLKYIVEF